MKPNSGYYYMTNNILDLTKKNISPTKTAGRSIILTLIKKENQIFLRYKEIQSGAVAKSHIRKGFLIYEDMHAQIFHHI